MGPLLILRRPGFVLGLLAVAGAAGSCNRCRQESRPIPLDGAYATYFGARPALSYDAPAPAVAAATSSGLTDSYPRVGVSTGTESLWYDCMEFRADSRLLTYSASLYGYQFRFRVVQYPEGPRLTVEDYSRDNPAATTFRYDFTTGKAEPLDYRNAVQGTLISRLTPEVREVATLTVGTRTYAPVWRITNPYLAQNGGPTAATVLYLSPQYGLVRFEQRDGTAWDLTP